MRFTRIILGRPTIVVFEFADDDSRFSNINVDLPQQTKEREIERETKEGKKKKRRMGFNPLDVRLILLPCS